MRPPSNGEEGWRKAGDLIFFGDSSTKATNSDFLSSLFGKSYPGEMMLDVLGGFEFHLRPRHCGIPQIAMTMYYR